MDFIYILKKHLETKYSKTYERSNQIRQNLGIPPIAFDQYMEDIFNQEINCGGYALEVDLCIFKGNQSFDRIVSALLDAFPFIRLLGNSAPTPDEYIVKYRASDSLGHHFIKLKDGKVTEKNEASPIQDFNGWSAALSSFPEATFAVKKEHPIFFETISLLLDSGKNFDETVTEAYQNKQNTFQYHSQEYSFKKDSKTGEMYICSSFNNKKLTIADIVIDDNDCIAVVRNGFDDFVSNTKTNYTVGPAQPKSHLSFHEI